MSCHTGTPQKDPLVLESPKQMIGDLLRGVKIVWKVPGGRLPSAVPLDPEEIPTAQRGNLATACSPDALSGP